MIGTPKAKPKARGSADGEKLADSVEKLVVETKVKSKNLNVVEEYRKSSLKKVANFVVIGRCHFSFCVAWGGIVLTQTNRSRGSRQEHAHGPSAVRPQDCGRALC